MSSADDADVPADALVARVQALVALANQHNIAELTVEAGDFRLRLRTRDSRAQVVADPIAAPPADPPGSPATATTAGAVITAPMIGTFYSGPSPNDPPFVSIGDHVEPGQTVAIIEAMKIMNEIQSDQAGVLVEVLARNGQGVEFGQPLFRLQADTPAAGA